MEKLRNEGWYCNEVRILWLENPSGDFIIYKFVLCLTLDDFEIWCLEVCFIVMLDDVEILSGCKGSFVRGWFIIGM